MAAARRGAIMPETHPTGPPPHKEDDMRERRLNPKDVYTPDDFLTDRMLDYERAESTAPGRSPDLMLGIVIGATVALPVYMLIFAFIDWVL